MENRHCKQSKAGSTKRKLGQFLSLALVLVLLSGLVYGCGKKNDVTKESLNSITKRQEIDTTSNGPSPASEVTATTTQTVATTTTGAPTETEHRVQIPAEHTWAMADPEVTVNGPAVAGLADLIHAYLKDRDLVDANLSIVYENLETHERYTYRGDARYDAASTVKVPMSMVVYQLMHEEVFPSDLKIKYEACNQFLGDGYTQAPEGSLIGIRDLIENAIRFSGNTSTSSIFNYFYKNGNYIHDVMDWRLGMHYANDNSMSANEGIRLMEELFYNPHGVAGYNELIDFMKNTTWRYYFTRHLEGVEIAHKYGLYSSAMNELGIVYAEVPYAFAIYTSEFEGYVFWPELGWLIHQWHTTGTANLAAIPPTQPPDFAEAVWNQIDGEINGTYDPNQPAVDPNDPETYVDPDAPETTTTEDPETTTTAPVTTTTQNVTKQTEWWEDDHRREPEDHDWQMPDTDLPDKDPFPDGPSGPPNEDIPGLPPGDNDKMRP